MSESWWAQYGWYEKGFLTPSSFGSGSRKGPTVTIPSGQTIRFVMGWLHCVEQSGETDDGEFLAADFDIKLREGTVSTGPVLVISQSSNNSLEALQYANTTGQAKQVSLWIEQYGGSGAWQTCNGEKREYYGIAYAIINENLGSLP